MQLEEGFLSQEETKGTLPSILKEIFHELNKNGKCTIQIGELMLSRSQARDVITFFGRGDGV